MSKGRKKGQGPMSFVLFSIVSEQEHALNLKSSAESLNERVQKPVYEIRKKMYFLTLSIKCDFHTIQCSRDRAYYHYLLFLVFFFFAFLRFLTHSSFEVLMYLFLP